MIKLPVSLVAAAALLMSTSAAAQDTAPRVFTRTGSWALDAGEDVCRLARAFTNGADQISLAMERNRADPVVRLVVVGNALAPYRSAEEIGYAFLPTNDQRSARYIQSETADGQGYFNFGTVFMGRNPFAGPPPADPAAPYDRAAELEFASSITGIEFNTGLTQSIRLETGSLRGAITALQACADDLLRTWGLDWERHQTMTRRAMPAGPAFEWVPAGIVGFQDFASFAGSQNPFRVMVSADGRPTSCTAHWVSLNARQNERICAAIMENGAFTPALDAAGQPMASYWMVDYLFGLSSPLPGR